MNYDLSKLLIEAAELLNEEGVKASKKHKLDNYLKKYNYDKKNKTITVDGKTVKVREKNKNDSDPYGSTMVGYSDGSQELELGKDFTKLKNNKRRDCTLRHELAHAKYQSYTDPNVTVDHKIEKLSRVKDPVQQEKLIDHVKKSGFKDRDNYSEKDKLRVKNLEIFREYDKGGHSIPIEYEADAYVRYNKNANSERDRSLREAYKHTRKHLEKKLDKESKRDWEKGVADDLRNRKKAVKDKRISVSAYQENVYELFFEAIDLLNL